MSSSLTPTVWRARSKGRNLFGSRGGPRGPLGSIPRLSASRGKVFLATRQFFTLKDGGSTPPRVVALQKAKRSSCRSFKPVINGFESRLEYLGAWSSGEDVCMTSRRSLVRFQQRPTLAGNDTRNTLGLRPEIGVLLVRRLDSTTHSSPARRARLATARGLVCR